MDENEDQNRRNDSEEDFSFVNKNSPFQDMLQQQKADRTPGFLNRKNKSARRGEAQNSLGAAENAAISGANGADKSGGGVLDKARQAEEKAGGFYSGSGRRTNKISAGEGKDKGVMKFGGKASAGIFLIFGLLIGVVAIFVFASPLYMIGSIDYNLQDSLGFSETSAILEEQGEYVTDEMLAAGEVPSEYAGRLAEQGIFVGQVTAAGDFVRTNTYIANIEELDDIAAIGSGFQVHGDAGELAVLFNDIVTLAGEFADTVENNPKMYKAYSEAANVATLYYYSDEVDEIYDDMGISRGSFSSWKRTGDSEADQAAFDEILNEVLADDTDATVNGCHESGSRTIGTNPDTGEDIIETVPEECNSAKVSGQGSASAVINSTANSFHGSGATEQAATLLNEAISSSEPNRAAKAFIAVEAPLQQARAGDNGPVNEAMNTLTHKTEITYTDVNTGEAVTKNMSILETPNFVAAVSNGKYSKDEADNFSRDRVINVTNTLNGGMIKETAMSTNGGTESNAAIETGFPWDPSADVGVLSAASDSVDIALVQDNAEQFRSVIGGNRIVEGGAYLNNIINNKLIGAMPSDEPTIAIYHNEAKEVLARRAEADRATLSPFDVSSPNTFLGSIVHGFATSMISSGVLTSGGAPVLSTVSAVANMTKDASDGITGGSAMADGNDGSYAMTFGNECHTVNGAGVVGDLYCSSHNTVATKYMKYTENDWKGVLGDNLASDGSINMAKMENNNKADDDKQLGIVLAADEGAVNDGGLAGFTVWGARDTTFGVSDGGVCEAYFEENASLWDRVVKFVASALGLWKACDGVPEEVAIGSIYTLSDANPNKAQVELYSGYTLHDEVYSLLSGRIGKVAEFKTKYYAEHPKDNSAAGKIARRSGMTKAEAEIALNYAAYLNVIARYDASDRIVFGETLAIETDEDALVGHSNKISGELYCFSKEEIWYRDERNRNFTM